MTRYTVHFSGRVQGVGFRYTARETASGYRVAGYVRNLPDRRVLLVAEGEKAELDAFLSDLSGRMVDYIRDRAVAESPATGEFGAPGAAGFEVRH